MLTCARCGFERKSGPPAGLELCPRCHAEGVDAYLRRTEAPRSRRHDLLGLLAIARAELAHRRHPGPGGPKA